MHRTLSAPQCGAYRRERSYKNQGFNSVQGYVYILECSDGSYYTGSTVDLELRLQQHRVGEGANYTKTRLPVKLLYSEEYDRIDVAFDREKQIQRWSRKKKTALINGQLKNLPKLSKKVFR